MRNRYLTIVAASALLTLTAVGTASAQVVVSSSRGPSGEGTGAGGQYTLADIQGALIGSGDASSRQTEIGPALPHSPRGCVGFTSADWELLAWVLVISNPRCPGRSCSRGFCFEPRPPGPSKSDRTPPARARPARLFVVPEGTLIRYRIRGSPTGEAGRTGSRTRAGR